MISRIRAAALVVIVAVFSITAVGQAKPKSAKPGAAGPHQAGAKPGAAGPHKAMPQANITAPPGTLYVVPYAHLDTQWRWEYPQVISDYLAHTLHDNFALFPKYPHYVFNFSGANRYGFFKEYYPADYVKLKQYIAEGRWFPAGSSMEESDVNSPSAESILRQVLYGNEFFRREFHVASIEYMLPDCFGFPASLPSILAHAGIKGFSTQKLTWHSAVPEGGPDSIERTPVGIPFNVGKWIGPDGKGVIAALNPGSYSADIRYDITKSQAPPSIADNENAMRNFVDWPGRVKLDGQVSGLYTDYHYYGTGDIGGSPRERSVALIEAILDKATTSLPGPRRRGEDDDQAAPPAGPPVKVGDGPLHVIEGNAELMFQAIKPGEEARLPKYSGDMELTEHSAGSLTSEAYHKHWNRRNEVLADDAERASVAADWLGARPYPIERLNRAWRLVMGGQFHDIQAGTATPRAYEFSWNDDVLAMNQFASVLNSASDGVASALNTNGPGTPVVVFNPLNIAREDVVEARFRNPGMLVNGVRVVGPDGKEVPSQMENETGAISVLFLARMPGVGYEVYDIEPRPAAAAATSTLSVSESGLENERYRIRLADNGDVSSIFDKKLNKELLSAPARLAFMHEAPHDWPAWNMDWNDQKEPPYGYVSGSPEVRVVENGPVRVALEVTRESEGMKFVQTIRLSAGDAGNRVEFGLDVDWKGKATALKAMFPLAASNPKATYNWDVGTIQRTNDDPKKYEVPSHQWFDLTDTSGSFGTTILSNDKYGSDKPDNNTLRLTLIYTPGLGEGNGKDYDDQTTQDWGHHEIWYGLAGHAGDWRQEQTDWQGFRLNQPLVAFTSSKHAGALGKSFSVLRVSNSRIRVLALKKAEEGNDFVVRAVEMSGQPQSNVRLTFAAPVVAARELDGQERAIGAATPAGGALVTSFTPYQIRTFAVKLAPPKSPAAAPHSVPVKLAYDSAVATTDGATSNGNGFDAQGDALASEMLPREISFSGIRFALAPGTGKDAVVAHGQQIALPAGQFDRVYVLAAADGDQDATFKVGEQTQNATVEDWGGFIGQWDTRTWNEHKVEVPGQREPDIKLEYTGLKPGFIKRAPVAWFASHHHNAAGENQPYAYSYLFAYRFDLPAGAHSITLPDNSKIRVLAITAAEVPGQVRPAAPLYDRLEYKIDPAAYAPASAASGQ